MLKSVNGLKASDNLIAETLRKYEKERIPRASIVTLRARIMGKVLGIYFKPVKSSISKYPL